jgi:hypothetical protein
VFVVLRPPDQVKTRQESPGQESCGQEAASGFARWLWSKGIDDGKLPVEGATRVMESKKHAPRSPTERKPMRLNGRRHVPDPR